MKRHTFVLPLVPGHSGRRLALIAVVSLALVGLAVNAFGQTSSVQLRGLVDIVATDLGDYRWYNTVNTNDSNFDALRARLFVEGQRGQTSVYLQFLISPESYDGYRFYGGYVMHRLFEDRNIFAEAGLIPVHDGIWAAQTYSNKNPLIGVPMSYYWKSTLPGYMMPTDLDQLLDNRGQGQQGVVYTDSTGIRGQPYSSMTMMYDNCWNYGAYALGSAGRFEFAVGVTLGTSGAPVSGADSNDNLAVHGKLGFAFTQGLRAWFSAAHGAYLSDYVQGYLPAGKSVNDYDQNLFGLSVDWKVWHLAFTGEAFTSRNETPLRADGLAVNSFWAQGVYALAPGWDLALRYDALRFEEVQNSLGQTMTWDLNVDRVETGVGYHLTRELILKGVVQLTKLQGAEYEAIPALQASFAF